jgi:hypothetical protein
MSAHSTIGVNVYYAWQSDGSRPTAGYTLLSSEITELPEFDSAPEGIDVTPLSELVAIRRIAGLKDNGDDFPLTGNINDTDMTTWEGLVSEAPDKIAAGNYLELMITVTGITKAYFVSGTPVALGFPGASVNSAFQGSYHFIPYQDHGWAAKGTISQ